MESFCFLAFPNQTIFSIHTIDNSIIHIAGIYNSTGCAIITEQSKGDLKDIHHRQPVLLSDSEIKLWLSGDNIQNSKLSNSINIHKVSTYVNSARNNDQKCIERI